MEELIIDGCNLCYKAYGGCSDRDRENLVRSLKGYYLGKKIRVTIVFDSSPGNDVQKVSAAFTIIYALPPADDHIVRLVERSDRPASLTVITDDRAVRDNVRSYGARHKGSVEFLEHWKGWKTRRVVSPAPDEKPAEETPEEIERYLDLWGE